ncbi:MAG: hypothetical protein JWN03_1208 [Nocardia sp.]|uniref:hypothetical protein n=1 Tax=Nocardia sp. TaxID=1821 RepID=UPI00261A6C15|nr:hypothetical protein [Nocardia sp.]MCU1640933.1 hypothetical protein [Nocardia sp.]
MEIIVAITITALVLLGIARVALPSSGRHDQPKRLTVTDIQARIAAEPPRAYVPIRRGW